MPRYTLQKIKNCPQQGSLKSAELKGHLRKITIQHRPVM